MVVRLIAKTDDGYDLDVHPDEIKTLEANGYLKAEFFIENNNDKGHYYELAYLWTKDFWFGETYKEFCQRVSKEFLDWVILMLA